MKYYLLLYVFYFFTNDYYYRDADYSQFHIISLLRTIP